MRARRASRSATCTRSAAFSLVSVCTCVRSWSVRAANRGQKMQRYLRDAQMYRIHPSAQSWLDAGRARTHWGMPLDRYGH